MKTLNLLISLLTLSTYELKAMEKPFGQQAQLILSEWFSIDPTHEINMDEKIISSDNKTRILKLQFISDDHKKVNGLLQMPINQKKPTSLAILLHPMGQSQNIWKNKNTPINVHLITQWLLENNYAILTLDARYHGARKVNGLGAKEILKRARSSNRRLYDDMVIGTTRDYRLILSWVIKKFNIKQNSILAIGYSMGGQMALLLASHDSRLNQVISIVPPYVDQENSPVAPRHHVHRIKQANILFLAGRDDPYSSIQQNEYVFDLIASSDKKLTFFDSGHLLPKDYIDTIWTWLSQTSGEEK